MELADLRNRLKRAMEHRARLIEIGGGGDRINVFIHGYKSLESGRHVARATERIDALKIPGRNYLLHWSSGKWRDSAMAATVRATYRISQYRRFVSPWTMLIDAGVITLAEVIQFKWMEQRAGQVGRDLGMLVDSIDGAKSMPINLIGHSLGSRVIHKALGQCDFTDLALHDCVMLGGAADLDSPDWTDCLAKVRGQLFNGYSRSDRVLALAPDFRRRIGSGPMAQVTQQAAAKIVDYRCDKVKHVEYWTNLARILPQVWPASYGRA